MFRVFIISFLSSLASLLGIFAFYIETDIRHLVRIDPISIDQFKEPGTDKIIYLANFETDVDLNHDLQNNLTIQLLNFDRNNNNIPYIITSMENVNLRSNIIDNKYTLFTGFIIRSDEILRTEDIFQMRFCFRFRGHFFFDHYALEGSALLSDVVPASQLNTVGVIERANIMGTYRPTRYQRSLFFKPECRYSFYEASYYLNHPNREKDSN